MLLQFRTSATTLFSHLSHVPHDGVFLCVDEALQHDPDGHVHIVTVNILSEVHPRVGLSYPYDGLNVTHCDGNTASSLRRERERDRQMEGNENVHVIAGSNVGQNL